MNMQMLLHKKNGIIKHLPKFMLLCWIILLCVFRFSEGANNWQNIGDITLKYFFAFPGALLTGFALKTKRLEIRNNYEIRLGKHMQRTHMAFFVYAAAVGIIVPQGRFMFANIINEANFINLFGLPIDYIRSISGIIVAYSTVIILEIFYLDHFQKAEVAEKEATIFAERERISHDIHDGTMQALYGIGLRLQYIDSLLKSENNNVVKEQLRYAMQKLNETSQEIRGYITNLRPHRENVIMLKEIEDVTRDFISETNIPVRFNFEQVNENIIIKEEIIIQVVFIIKEILNNVRKHASATLVLLTIVLASNKIEISIEDDGLGFAYNEEGIQSKGIGLNSINKRVSDLNGKLSITSRIDAGTRVFLEIPLEDK
jgi:signal transduction histidine kinase